MSWQIDLIANEPGLFQNKAVIRYEDSLEGIRPEQLMGGFFDGWVTSPTPETHLQILIASSHVVLALNDESNVVGLVRVISDHIYSAYVAHLEVLPDYKGLGIGKELMVRIKEQLRQFYIIDLCCDDNVVEFYDKLGFRHCNGMIIRNYDRRACN
jgi:ribosomal protein S18 acetylase RimI-like enzyme